MSIFGKIKDAIFGHHAEAAEAQPQAGGTGHAGGAQAGVNSSAGPGQTPGTVQQTAASGAPPVQAGTAPQAQPQTQAQVSGASARSVDVEAIMNAAVKKNGQPLDWRHSIVDMMKALDLDSSLAARKELAEELHYTGDKNDSAQMNVWLHKALMQKLAENGGKVPADLIN
ncbi:hypothetical protein GCM10011390_40560 [Aureimonas endophytica]|uniref:DUF3597 domain-containing protein n=1 Tax=Aureimonas endophytica TaxID=2027858 RepID=A0A916ZWX6_9HYPH|nr:DUF3597 domain-containing protein [Aureimonas endophytica]GGE17358.1 hypothetical protein GCM10011390_40560 [Aureimonas endophytica]